MNKSERRIYQLKGYLNLEMSININGTHKTIVFKGGTRTPKLIPGKYVTDDKDVQKALEKHSRHGKLYSLYSINGKLVSKEASILSVEQKYSRLKLERDDLLKRINEDPRVAELAEELQSARDLNVILKHEKETLSNEIRSLLKIIDTHKELTVANDTVDTPIEKDIEPKEITAEGIVNAQMARDYLIEHHQLTTKSLANPKAIRNAAAKLSITFPDWNE